MQKELTLSAFKFYNIFIKLINASYWSLLSFADDSSNCFCLELTNVESELSSSKNCETVIPNAVQIRSMEGRVGNIPFLYQEEIVDWVNPECSANWYSVQFFCFLNSVIRFNTSIIGNHQFSTILYLCVNYVATIRCNIIYNVVYL